jgi:hypothetical protein
LQLSKQGLEVRRGRAYSFLPSWLLAPTVLLQRSTPAFSNSVTKDPSPFEQRLDQIRIKHLKNSPQGRRLIADSCEDLCTQCVEIDVYFHLSAIPIPTDDGSGSEQFIFPHPLESVARLATSDEILAIEGFASLQDIYSVIDTNMQVLNERFAVSPFVFTRRNTDPASASVSANPDMVDFALETLFDENGVAAELHTGDATVLNVYAIRFYIETCSFDKRCLQIADSSLTSLSRKSCIAAFQPRALLMQNCPRFQYCGRILTRRG